MISTFWLTVIILGSIGLLAALVLYIVARKFHVDEDPRIALIEELLPGANCGGCGKKGCHDFACSCASAASLERLVCPGAGAEAMSKIAEIVGLSAVQNERKVAVIACDGNCHNRRRTSIYDGVQSCVIEAAIYEGDTDCPYGCLGCGDCVAACPYGALTLNHDTALPEVDFSTCVGCGKCTETCPRDLIRLQKMPSDDAGLVWVACRNKDKGPVAVKECNVSCIGCGKCKKSCPADAISVTDFLAEIDASKCIKCGICATQCPRKTILTYRLPEVAEKI